MFDLCTDPPKVEVWALHLKAPDRVVEYCRGLLSPDETARANHFAFDHLRRSYALSRGALRVLLGQYTKYPAEGIAIATGARGKPALQDQSLRVCFNLSHSAGLALYAFTAGCEIGVDVEQVREIPEIEAICARFFSNAESAEILSIDDAASREQAFYRCWTRKEAYIKAIGDGFFLPLDRFAVTLARDDKPRFRHIDGDPEIAGEWTLQHLDPCPGFLGALCYRAPEREIAFRAPCDAGDLIEEIAAPPPVSTSV